MVEGPARSAPMATRHDQAKILMRSGARHETRPLDPHPVIPDLIRDPPALAGSTSMAIVFANVRLMPKVEIVSVNCHQGLDGAL